MTDLLQGEKKKLFCKKVFSSPPALSRHSLKRRRNPLIIFKKLLFTFFKNAMFTLWVDLEFWEFKN